MLPLVNVICVAGDYYLYQPESILKTAGLTTDLSKKSAVDRFFVTSQIKTIASMASVVVKNALIPELKKLVDESKDEHIKLMRNMVHDEDEYDDMDPLLHEITA